MAVGEASEHRQEAVDLVADFEVAVDHAGIVRCGQITRLYFDWQGSTRTTHVATAVADELRGVDIELSTRGEADVEARHVGRLLDHILVG